MTCTAVRRLLLAARRRSRRILDVLFLGTPTALSLLVQLEVLQLGEAGIYPVGGAPALPFVQVLAAGPAEALAVLAADRVHRQCKEHLLTHQRVEVDGLSVEELLVGSLQVKAPSPLLG